MRQIPEVPSRHRGNAGPARPRRARWLALTLLASAGAASAAGLLDLSYRPLAGKTPVNLQKTYGGDVLLVVNSASKCGVRGLQPCSG